MEYQETLRNTKKLSWNTKDLLCYDLGMDLACFGNVLGMIWGCSGNALVMFWGRFGNRLGNIIRQFVVNVWECIGDVSVICTELFGTFPHSYMFLITVYQIARNRCYWATIFVPRVRGTKIRS